MCQHMLVIYGKWGYDLAVISKRQMSGKWGGGGLSVTHGKV